MKVYILQHLRHEDELDGYKIIGIFSSKENTQDIAASLLIKPGFKDYQDNFEIGEYELDKVFGGDGFG